MRHPVRDVHINSVNTGGRNFTHTLHVLLAPLLCIRSDPHIFIAFPDPKRSSAGKYRGLTCDLALQPIGMIFDNRVRGLVGMCRNAFCASDVHVHFIVGLVYLLRYVPQDFEFLSRIEKALVASGDVVVHFNAEDVIFGRLAYDLIRIVTIQAVGADAYLMGPILFGLLSSRIG